MYSSVLPEGHCLDEDGTPRPQDHFLGSFQDAVLHCAEHIDICKGVFDYGNDDAFTGVLVQNGGLIRIAALIQWAERRSP